MALPFAFCFSAHTSLFALSVIFILRAAHYHCYCLTICVYRSKSARGYLFFPSFLTALHSFFVMTHRSRSWEVFSSVFFFSCVVFFFVLFCSFCAQSKHKRPNTYTKH
uniref:(northern house mosquito) hypothetical protein n=1 Tax=Culex pipiens TaxID=7175 RepID=A0A8D8AG42_CULPI